MTNKKTQFEFVEEFRKSIQLPINKDLTYLTDRDLAILQKKMLRFIDGHLHQNPTQVADNLVDMVYLLLGCAHQMGIDFDAIFDIVHSSNMKRNKPNEFELTLAEGGHQTTRSMDWEDPEIEISHILSKLK